MVLLCRFAHYSLNIYVPFNCMSHKIYYPQILECFLSVASTKASFYLLKTEDQMGIYDGKCRYLFYGREC